MARQGKDFELLIKKLEEVFLSNDAVVNSPDFITDKVTNQKREVDISIRSNIGSTPILIIVECRDRQNVQDVTWIEQVITKTKDLNADKVIVVSSSGFTPAAISKAKYCGILTRTYSEILYEDIESWFALKEFIRYDQSVTILNAAVNLFPNTEIDLTLLSKFTYTDKVFYYPNSDKSHSVEDIIKHELNINKIWETVPIDGAYHKKEIIVKPVKPFEWCYLSSNGNKLHVASIEFDLELMVEENKFPISKIMSYNDNEGPILQAVEFNNALPDTAAPLQFIKMKNGKILISARKKDE